MRGLGLWNEENDLLGAGTEGLKGGETGDLMGGGSASIDASYGLDRVARVSATVTVECGGGVSGQVAQGPGLGLGLGLVQGKGRVNPVPGHYDAKSHMVMWDCSGLLPKVDRGSTSGGGNSSGGGGSSSSGSEGGSSDGGVHSVSLPQPWLFDFEVLIAGDRHPSSSPPPLPLPPPDDAVPITVSGYLTYRLISGLDISVLSTHPINTPTSLSTPAAYQPSVVQPFHAPLAFHSSTNTNTSANSQWTTRQSSVTRSEHVQFECKFV